MFNNFEFDDEEWKRTNERMNKRLNFLHLHAFHVFYASLNHTWCGEYFCLFVCNVQFYSVSSTHFYSVSVVFAFFVSVCFVKNEHSIQLQFCDHIRKFIEVNQLLNQALSPQNHQKTCCSLNGCQIDYHRMEIRLMRIEWMSFYWWYNACYSCHDAVDVKLLESASHEWQ